MASVNKVILVGNLGRDPETRTFPSGDQICNVTLATTDKWKDKQSGEMKEATEWHRLVFNGRLAEIAAVDDTARSMGNMAILLTLEKSKPGSKSMVAVGVLLQADTSTASKTIESVRI